MNKAIILMLAISTIFLYGCTNTNPQSNTSNLTGDQNQDFFSKKEKCASYKSDMEKEIESYYNPERVSIYLNSIFYSPKRDSCLYIAGGYSTIDENTIINFERVFDFFTKELVLGTPNYCSGGTVPYGQGDCLKEETTFLDNLSELQGQ